MKSVLDEGFKMYGRVLDVDAIEFMDEVQKLPVAPQGQVLYEASIPSFEQTKLFLKFMDEIYGGMPVEFGCCQGFNDKLNGLEYHRDSEINIAGTDMILMVGHRWDIDYGDNSYDTSKVEAFFVPQGTVVEYLPRPYITHHAVWVGRSFAVASFSLVVPTRLWMWCRRPRGSRQCFLPSISGCWFILKVAKQAG